MLVTDDVTITDPEADVTIDAGGNSRIFYLNTAGAVTLTGLTLTGGDGFSGDNGGAIVSSNTDLTIVDSTFSGNVALVGGGIAAFGGSATVTGTTFTDNYAENYGGGALFYDVDTVSVTGSTFTSNEAGDSYGGGFMVDHGASLTVSDSTFTDNDADGDGGGFHTADVDRPTTCWPAAPP